MMKLNFDFHPTNGDGESGFVIAVFNRATMRLDIRMADPEAMDVSDEEFLKSLGYDDPRYMEWTKLETMTINIPNKTIEK